MKAPWHRNGETLSANGLSYRLVAEPTRFRVELGNLLVTGHAEGLGQAKRFSEKALEWLLELEKQLDDMEPVPPPRDNEDVRRPVAWGYSVSCAECDAGIRMNAAYGREICPCVRPR